MDSRKELLPGGVSANSTTRPVNFSRKQAIHEKCMYSSKQATEQRPDLLYRASWLLYRSIHIGQGTRYTQLRIGIRILLLLLLLLLLIHQRTHIYRNVFGLSVHSDSISMDIGWEAHPVNRAQGRSSFRRT